MEKHEQECVSPKVELEVNQHGYFTGNYTCLTCGKILNRLPGLDPTLPHQVDPRSSNTSP